MTLPMPYLDDRNFEQLLAEAKTVIQRSCPQWSDLSVHDPGVVLLEAFAYLTETLIFRVNRFPERVHAALLNLLGVALDPPAAASTVLRFAWERPGNAAVDIPAGTRVGVSGQSGANAAIFATVTKAKLPADADATVDVPAYHFTPVSSELIGYGSGEGDQILRMSQRPIVNLPGRGSSLRVAVELGVGETAGPAGGITINDAQYEWWPVVADFARFAGSRICRADLVDGAISFAPALDPRDGTAAGPMGAVPAAGRRIIAWYATGGGPDGNVVPGTLTLLKEQIPGVKVTNPEPATGGRAMEDLANAFKRGPQQFRSQNRAVTARDYEVLALRAGASVARAKAFTRAEAWTYAEPGEVEVVLVPNVGSPTGAQTVVSPAELIAHRREGDRELVAAALADSQPLGTRSIVRWANAKTVQVKATVVIRPEEDAAAVQRRVLDRLHRHICPVPAGGEGGWPFGEPLRISNVYRLLEEHEPGIRFVEAVRLVVDSTPDADVKDGDL